MKQKNCNWIYSLVIMGLFIMLTNSCKKGEDVAQTPVSTITADKLTVNQLEIVSLTPSNITFGQTEYSGTIGGQNVKLLPVANKLVFSVPEISAGTQTLTTTIEGKDYSFLFTVMQLAPITDAQQVVNTVLLPALMNAEQLDSLGAFVQQFHADSNWAENKTILKNYYDDFNTQYDALSGTDKLQLAKILKANEGLFGQLLDIREIIDSTNNYFKPQGDYDFDANLNEGMLKLSKSKFQLVVLIASTAFTVDACIAVPTPWTCGFAAACAAALGIKLYHHNTVVKALLDKVFEPFEAMIDKVREKSGITLRNNQVYGFSVSLNIRTLYSPDMNSSKSGVQGMVTELNESATAWEEATEVLPKKFKDKPAHITNKTSYKSKNFAYSGNNFSIGNISNPQVSVASQNIVGNELKVGFTTSASTDQTFTFDLKYNKGQYSINQNVSATITISSRAALLVENTWKILYSKTNGVPDPINDCEKDDILTFISNGTWTYNMNSTPCPDQSNDTGNWTLSSDEKYLTINGDIYYIVELTASKLVILLGTGAYTEELGFTAW
jgi:hypothetical protein